jgi:hypothetical protein
VSGYLVLVDGARYVAQAKTGAEAEQRVCAVLGSAGELVHASRRLSDDELAVLQLRPGEVRLEPAEHG